MFLNTAKYLKEIVCVCKQLLRKTSCSRKYFYFNMEHNVISITFSIILHIIYSKYKSGCGSNAVILAQRWERWENHRLKANLGYKDFFSNNTQTNKEDKLPQWK